MKLSVYCRQCSHDDFKRNYMEGAYICKNCGKGHGQSELVIVGRISEETLRAVVETLAEEGDE